MGGGQMDFSKALAECSDNALITDHRADPKAQRAKDPYPPRRVFDGFTELLGKRLRFLFVLLANASDFFRVLKLRDQRVDIVAHVGPFLGGLRGALPPCPSLRRRRPPSEEGGGGSAL